MSVLLACIGDLHLAAESPRYQHTLDVLDWVIADATAAAEARQSQLLFLLGGDLTEATQSLRSYNRVLRDLLPRVSAMVDRGDVGVVLGNHDPEGLLDWWDVINPRIHVAASRFEVLETLGANVLLVPYPRRGRPPFDALDDDGTIQGSLRAAADQIRDVVQFTRGKEPGVPLIVLGHFAVEGMTTRDTAFEQHHATEVVVPRDAFDDVDLVAVAHIHRAQEFPPNIVGMGGLIRHDFAEALDAKSYTLVTVDDGASQWERRPVPARDMIELALDWSQIREHPFAQHRDVYMGLEVKIVVSVREDELATFDPSQFDPIKEVAALFLLEKVTIPVERTRAPELAQAQTLEDQLVVWLRSVGQEARAARLLPKVAEIRSE